MLTQTVCSIVLKNAFSRSVMVHFPRSSCLFTRLSSTLNDNKGTIKAVLPAATEAKTPPERVNSKQSSSGDGSKNVVMNEKMKKKLGKYVEGDKINYKEVHKQAKIDEELKIVNDIKVRGVKLSDFPLPSDNNVILPVSLATGNSKDLLKYRMSLAKKRFEYFDGDTGSPAVQIAMMTEKIKNSVRHFALHRKDHSSGRNFEILLSRRKRLLNYLRKYNFDNFKVVIKELDLQKEGLELIRKNK